MHPVVVQEPVVVVYHDNHTIRIFIPDSLKDHLALAGLTC